MICWIKPIFNKPRSDLNRIRSSSLVPVLDLWHYYVTILESFSPSLSLSLSFILSSSYCELWVGVNTGWVRRLRILGNFFSFLWFNNFPLSSFFSHVSLFFSLILSIFLFLSLPSLITSNPVSPHLSMWPFSVGFLFGQIFKSRISHVKRNQMLSSCLLQSKSQIENRETFYGRESRKREEWRGISQKCVYIERESEGKKVFIMTA